MRTHNHLLGRVNGCDGFKTGYFVAAGFSIVATAQRSGVRVIAIVMGSKDRKVRNSKAEELLAKGFALAATMPDDPVVVRLPELVQEKTEIAVSAEPETLVPLNKQQEPVVSSDGGWTMFFWGLAVGLAISALLAIYISRKRSRRKSNYRSYR